MRGIGDPESTSTAFFVTVGVIVVVVVVLLVIGYFYSYEQALSDQRLVETRIEAVEAYEAEQRERLETYGWADAEKTTVHIPIERAMEKVAEREGRR